MPELVDEAVPLCFDTSAVYAPGRATFDFLRRVRIRFPARALIIPSIVVIEKVRQESERLSRVRREYDPTIFWGFLTSDDLRLQIASLDDVCAIDHSHPVLRKATPWSWESLPNRVPNAPYEVARPCAERCRLGDHLVYMTARRHAALLISNDKVLIAAVVADGYRPGARNREALEATLGDVQRV